MTWWKTVSEAARSKFVLFHTFGGTVATLFLAAKGWLAAPLPTVVVVATISLALALSALSTEVAWSVLVEPPEVEVSGNE